ncbi:hypothetical protein [Actinomadura darangshiensis]|nr:hypothetical protein [Actinomadura darangshiensis]
MRAINNEPPFPNAKKKGKRKNSDLRSGNFAAGDRSNARRMPTRQFNRGR